MNLTPDSEAILLMTSHIGLAVASHLLPLTLQEWNELAKNLDSHSLRPEALLEMLPGDLQDKLGLSQDESERYKHLLQRSGTLAIELERLSSLGVQVITRVDNGYPERYRQRLKGKAPLVLFFAGEKALLGQPGIAVVGSRHLDKAGEECAEFVGNACGHSGSVLYSGGAKGVDCISMKASLSARGYAVGILSNDLERAIRDPEYRSAIRSGNLCLATPYSPSAPFSVGTAMGRNKLIYTLADYAIVVASDAEKGGTWAGATEALKSNWIPIFALDHIEMPDGNRRLIQKGAKSFPHPFTKGSKNLQAWLLEHSQICDPEPSQPTLF